MNQNSKQDDDFIIEMTSRAFKEFLLVSYRQGFKESCLFVDLDSKDIDELAESWSDEVLNEASNFLKEKENDVS